MWSWRVWRPGSGLASAKGDGLVDLGIDAGHERLVGGLVEETVGDHRALEALDSVALAEGVDFLLRAVELGVGHGSDRGSGR